MNLRSDSRRSRLAGIDHVRTATATAKPPSRPAGEVDQERWVDVGGAFGQRLADYPSLRNQNSNMCVVVNGNGSPTGLVQWGCGTVYDTGWVPDL